ncbi:MAG TPA: hypothetical protein VNM16_10430 [Bacillota bacterium]|nr:hypothetical protein [Bacillota bacterium]
MCGQRAEPVTGLSVLVAFVDGTVELLQVVTGELHWNVGLGAVVQNVDFETLGYLIAALFMATGAIAYAVWKVGRVEEKWVRSGG